MLIIEISTTKTEKKCKRVFRISGQFNICFLDKCSEQNTVMEFEAKKGAVSYLTPNFFYSNKLNFGVTSW